MILLPNIEGKIWDLEYKVNEIWQELRSQDCVTISLNGEGPCAEGLGLYRLLDDLCSRGKFDKKKIKITTCNQLEAHDYYQIDRSPPLYIEETQQFYQTNHDCLRDKKFDSNLKHFGLLIGRSNWVRLWLSADVYRNHPDKLLLSYHWDPTNDFHLYHLGIDEMLRWNANLGDVENSLFLLKACPIIIDRVDEYPVLSPQHLSVCRVYHEFFLELICETYFNGNSFYPTEKTWRPLIAKTPFIIHGPVNFLANLKKLGFKTFDKWWDESYDDYGHDLRINQILILINQLSKKSANELETMYQEMLPILDHNFKRFMYLSPGDFDKAFGYHAQ